MDGWIAALIAISILAFGGITLGLFALYQKHKENLKQSP